MKKRLLCALALVFLGSCTANDYRDLQHSLAQTAMDRLHQTLAAQFAKQFGHGIDRALTSLAAENGFLSNPLVKILLPPPMGLVMDVGLTLYRDPEAALLETLINRAAAEAMPVAHPILQAALTQLIEGDDFEAIYSTGKTAATDTLEVRSRALIRESLSPVITQSLQNSGAMDLYETLALTTTIAQSMRSAKVATPQEAIDAIDESALNSQAITTEELGAYVTDKAVEGIFKTLRKEESSLRQRLQSNIDF